MNAINRIIFTRTALSPRLRRENAGAPLQRAVSHTLCGPLFCLRRG